MSTFTAEIPSSGRLYCRSGEVATRLGPAVADNAQDEEKLPKPVRCRQCGLVITAVEEQTAINGSFCHTFFNPAGIVFELGCFRRATGCQVVGSPTDEFTWFPGFFWRFAFCGQCRSHLGWHYASPSTGAGFFGLILNRLQGI